MDANETLAADLLRRRGLRPERFTKAERRSGKTPDFRVFQGTAGPPVSPVDFSFRPILKLNPENEQIRNWYATAYLNQGIYSVFGSRDTAMAVALLRRSLDVKGDFAPAQQWLRRLGAMP